MRKGFAALATMALIAIVAPSPTRAGVLPPDALVQSVGDGEIAYAKWKGGKGWKGTKMKRGGPPPWAPAWGRRYRR
jgi:hypothetical protein